MERRVRQESLGLQVRFVDKIPEVMAPVLRGGIKHCLRRHGSLDSRWNLWYGVLGRPGRLTLGTGTRDVVVVMVMMREVLVSWRGYRRVALEVPERRVSLGGLILQAMVVVMMAIWLVTTVLKEDC